MSGDGRVQAPYGARRVPVTGRRDVGAYVVLTVADPAGPRPQAGQFYMLAAEEGWGAGEDDRPFLPRAFSVLRASEGTAPELSFMLEDVGPGTHRLAALEAGEAVALTGPLGVGFRAPAEGARAVLCGGGVGTAPLAIWQDELRAAGIAETALLGFRDAAHAAGAELLRDVRVATDDGSHGRHGRVTELLAEELDADPAATVYACGPPRMLEAVRALCAQRGAPCQLALESSMACGYGACYGCVVETVDDGFVRLCVDGPVLDGERLLAVAP